MINFYHHKDWRKIAVLPALDIFRGGKTVAVYLSWLCFCVGLFWMEDL